MAWVTTIGPDADQIAYRLEADAGCSLSVGEDGQVAYRLDSDRPLEWVGDGLREVGIEPGSVLDDAGKKQAKALADGAHPDTGEVLVAPKMAVDPRGKLPAGPLVDAVRQAADVAGVTPAQLLTDERVAARYGRMARGLAREREAHRVPVADLARVAAAADVDLDAVYPAADLELARQHAGDRVQVGNRGYDLTLDLPKSYSVLVGLADPVLARELEDVYLEAVRETITAVQGWAGYGMRGHHGDGQQAERVDGTGLLGWMTVHRTARPVAGAAPDPHLHAHVTLLNLVRGVDGRWSTIGAGGRDIHRHAHAADALVKARLRAMTRQRWGMEWVRDERTDAWEVAAIPERLRVRMSKRAAQVEAAMRDAGVDQAAATAVEQKVVAARTREAKQPPAAGGDLRAEWRRQAVAAGVDPAAVVAAATPGPGGPPPVALAARQLAEWVFRPEDGLTGHRKVTTRADVLAAVLDSTRSGVDGLATAEDLVDQVLAVDDVAVGLPPSGATHLTNSQRYTSTDVVDAERAVLAAARDRYGSNTAVVDADVLDLAVGQFEAGAGFQLSAEQRAVLARLTGAGHGVDAVIGVAGAGKTTLMSVLRAAYAATGRTVAGAATAAVAAQNLHTEAGIDSRTIASWLHRIDAGDGLAGVDVLVVDEAAMVDDRHMARLLAAAGQAGTKVIGIGDPLQLKAVGVGGTFTAVHALLNGLTLTENRRQRDVDERTALALWRADARRQALYRWADTGRVHATINPADAHADLIAAWARERTRWADPHDRIDRLVVLAHTNDDVDALNAAARAVRVAAGELPGRQRVYQLRDGGSLTLAVGDQVLLRVNDRRRQDVDVLNGFRGIVTAIGAGRMQVEWRRPGPDGPELTRAWVTDRYVARGGVSLGYAMTAAKAQGLTADRALVYGNGMEANVLYPAMSRDRHRADLWLALAPLEDDTDWARLGEPADAAETMRRAVAAYANRLEHDQPDRLILTELGQTPDPIPAAGRDQAHAEHHREREPATTTRRAVGSPPTAVPDWRRRPHGRIPGAELPAAIADADRTAAQLARDAAQAADRARQLADAAAAGDGPAARRLHTEREQLAAQVAAGTEAQQLRERQTAAQDTARQARQEIQRLDAELRRNRLALRLAGTPRAQLTQRREELHTIAVDAAGEAGGYGTRIWELDRAAGGPSGARRAAAELGTLDAGWTRRHAAAVDVDQHAADRAGRAAATTLAHAQRWQRHAARLRTEAELRDSMPPAQARAEDLARQTAQAAEAARRARRPPPAPDREPHYQPRPRIDRGPSLGL